MERVQDKAIILVKSLYASYRAAAMKEVAREMNLAFTKIASAGEKYGPNIVPKNMEYVSVDSGERNIEFWQKVDAIAPPPTADEIKSGKFPNTVKEETH